MYWILLQLMMEFEKKFGMDGAMRENIEQNSKNKKRKIVDAVQKQLIGFRIFVTNIGVEPRVIERFEAAIMINLYQQIPPICDIPDKGMQLSKRLENEVPFLVKNRSNFKLYGLPNIIEI